MKNQTMPAVALQYLKQRGVNVKKTRLNKRGIYWDDKRGIVMPVFGADGKKIPGMEVWRVFKKGFGNKLQPLSGKNKFKMTTGKGNPALFDPCIDYKSKDAIIIGEGPLRMFAAHDHLQDAACIAIHGIYGWTLKDSFCQKLRPELASMDWTNKVVYIAFDKGSKDVSSAKQLLANLLIAAGAIVRDLDWDSEVIPKVKDPNNPKKHLSKPGLDDLLYANKYTSAEEMYGLNIFTDLKIDRRFIELHKMSAELAVIISLKKYYRLTTDARGLLNERLCSEAEARNVLYADRYYKNDKGHKVQTFPDWNSWPHRRKYESLVYTPGAEQDIATPTGTALNIWPGWGVESVKGDVKPFLDLVDHLFVGQPKGHKEYFLQWLAYPIQNPGARMYVAYLLYSPARKNNKGIGKTLLAYLVGDIYGKGKNFVEITNKNIKSRSEFNGWIMGKQFILIDEILMSRGKDDNQSLKKLITQEDIEVRLMRTDPISMPAHYNIIMTSDQENALYIENGERRFAVVNIQVPPKPRPFYKRIDKWRRQENGVSHLFYYLLHEVDYTGFDPHAAAPFSDTREELRDQSKGDEEHFADELPAMLEQEWRKLGKNIKPREIYSAAELAEMYNEKAAMRKERNAIGRALKKAGYEQRNVKVNGNTVRMWAVKNMKKWAKTDSINWRNEYQRYSL